MARIAALASMVEASTPIRSPLTNPRSASRPSTQVNTASCASSGSRARVRLSQEWSGTGSLRRQPVAVDALEVADQQHAEVAPRRQRGPAPARGVVGRALPFEAWFETGSHVRLGWLCWDG